MKRLSTGGKHVVVIAAANLDDLAEGVERISPSREVPPEVFQVEIVLERLLEVVGGHQFDQVVGLRSVGQLPQPHDPVPVHLRLVADECLEELAFPDAFERALELGQLGAEALQRDGVELRGPAVQLELAVRIRRAEQAFLDRLVRAVALDQDRPRHERAVELSFGGVGPPGAQQRFVGKGAAQAHAIEILLGLRRLAGGNQAAAEQQVGLVLDRKGRFIVGLEQPRLFELGEARGLLAALDQGNAEVICGVTLESLFGFDPLQYLDRLRKLAGMQVYLRPQQEFLVSDPLRNATLDFLDGGKCRSGVVLLHEDAGKSPPSFVSNRLVDITLENGFDRASCALVHSVGQLEVAYGEIGLVDLIVQWVQFRVVETIELPEFGVQAADGVEIVALRCLVVGLTQIEILRARLFRRRR